MHERSLARHLIAIVILKMVILTGIWYLLIKPYKVKPTVAQVSQVVLGSPNIEGTTNAKH